MRADRLLRMMMILQTKGRQTAQDLAKELEVSVRTIYRDVTALSTSGVPVYTEKGPGGGIQLIDEYRTSLTGFSPEEVQALFMLSVPSAAASLGIGEEVQRAMLKLAAALPSYLRDAQAGVQQRIMIDTDWWQDTRELAPSFLQDLYRAVWEDRVVNIEVAYAFGHRAAYQVEAYGLVSRGRYWVFICRVAGNFKAFFTNDIDAFEITEKSFERDIGFDLASFWQDWSSKSGVAVQAFEVQLLVTDWGLAYLQKGLVNVHVEFVDEGDQDGWRLANLRFPSFEDARRTILGMGGSVRVVSPDALRFSVRDFARQILDQYPG
jgi:predicted DNA-binding transcriptional regulator YafY